MITVRGNTDLTLHKFDPLHRRLRRRRLHYAGDQRQHGDTNQTCADIHQATIASPVRAAIVRKYNMSITTLSAFHLDVTAAPG
ncbi:hypothetical protein GCM10011408_17910 [Dyella caseinilytica]|nr:hypothetical protein GCM10011408_17910 [Dyella caseinilytica]